MRELSMHVLDLAQNSIVAGASLIYIKVNADSVQDILEIEIADNGKGMDAEYAASVMDPFVTTRTTRRVGLAFRCWPRQPGPAEGPDRSKPAGQRHDSSGIVCIEPHRPRSLGDMTATIMSLVAANPTLI